MEEAAIETQAPQEAPAGAPAPPLSPPWDRTTRYIVFVGLVIFGIWALTLLSPVLTMLVISFIISFLMYRPALFLQTRVRLPWWAAVSLLYLAAGAVLTLAVFLLIPEIVKGFNYLVSTFDEAYKNLQTTLYQDQAEWSSVGILGFTLDVNPIIEALRGVIPSQVPATDPANGAAQAIDFSTLQEILGQFFNVASEITNFLTRLVGGVAGLFTSVLLGSLLSWLILLDTPRNRNLLFRLSNPVYHRDIGMLIGQLQQTWWAFFQGQVVLALIIAVLTYFQLQVTGIAGALLFAVLTGFLVFIPTIGGFIALIPQVAAAALSGSTTFPDLAHVWVALLVILGNVIISQLVWNVLSPKILGDALKLPTAVVICAVFVGAALGGLMGAFLIAPLASSVRILVNYLLHKVSGSDPFPEPPPEPPEPAPRTRAGTPRTRARLNQSVPAPETSAPACIKACPRRNSQHPPESRRA